MKEYDEIKMTVGKVIKKTTEEDSKSKTNFKHKLNPYTEGEDDSSPLRDNAGMINTTRKLFKPGDVVEIKVKESQKTLE